VPRLAVLGDEQHRTAPLTAQGEPLDHPQQRQQQRRGQADRRVGRQQADRERRAPHHQQADDQQLFAADPVAEVAEDQAAQRARDEPHGVGGERQHGADQRVGLGEEDVVEHERGGRAVEEEVVPLDRRADEAGGDHPPEGGFLSHVRNRRERGRS
jgi:hypothetical protein